MNSDLYKLGPGLTFQSGPTRFSKSDRPSIQKFPWKGGGVSGGGLIHAGHGNWFVEMDPPSLKSNYSKFESFYKPLILNPRPFSTKKQNKGIGFQRSGQVTGKSFLNSGIQKPNLGDSIQNREGGNLRSDFEETIK